MASRFSILAATSALAVVLTSTAQAQTVDDEIIVTATKRSETVFDVPVAVTAVTAAELDQAKVRDVADLQNVAPTLTYNNSTGGLQSVFTIRGIGTAGQNTGLEQSVGVVIDGVARGRPGAALGDYVDINQIEVLRGPQGTIFGKNTSGGVINVRTAKPSFETKAKADLTYGNYDMRQVRASVTGPLSDTLAASLSGSIHKRGGYIENLTPGMPDSNDRDRWSIRGQLLWEPTDDVSLRIIADHAEADEVCCSPVNLLSGPTAAIVESLGGQLTPTTPGSIGPYSGGIGDLGDRAFYGNAEQPLTDPFDDSGISAELEWNLGGVTATAIGSYRTFESLPVVDGDFTSLDMFTAITTGQDLDEKSLELRFASNGDSSIDWMIGGYYFDQHIDAISSLGYGGDTRAYFDAVIDDLAPIPGLINLIGLLSGVDQSTFFPAVASTEFIPYDSESTAVFGNATWHASDRLDLTAGFRYTDETKSADYNITSSDPFATINLPAINPLLQPIGGLLQLAIPVDPFSTEFKDDNFSIALSASYEVSDNFNLYGRFAQGYKSGGLNLTRTGPNTSPAASDRTANYDELVAADPSLTPLQSLQNAVTFQPEEVDAYELGFKSRFLENRLKLDATLYTQTLENFQANSFNGTVFTVRNAGEVRSRGLEIDYNARLSDHFLLSGAATFQDVEYKSFEGAAATASQEESEQDLTGEKPNFVSDVVLTGSLNYNRPVSDTLEMASRIGYRYRSDYTTAQDNDISSLQDDFITFDASIGIGKIDGPWAFDLWMKNVTDEDVINIAFDTPLQSGSFSATLEAPRTYGATLRLNWD